MKRILSIVCIIFLIGITSAVPYYSTSYFVYASGETETLSDNDIIDAGLSVYLNSKNAFITATAGGKSAIKAEMRSMIDTYYLFTDTIVVSDAILIANILIKYSPFRVSLKGPAVRFFNDLYEYLYDEGKIPNANNSNGGNTNDLLYEGYMIGNNLFYVYNNTEKTEFDNFSSLPGNKLISRGNVIDHFSGNYCISRYNSLNPNLPLNQTGPYNAVTGITIRYSQNIVWGDGGSSYGIYKLDGHSNLYYVKMAPYLYPANWPDQSLQGTVLYADSTYKVVGSACWFVTNMNSNYYQYGFVSHDLTNDRYFFSRVGIYERNDIPDHVNNANVRFETDNVIKTPTTVPEGTKDIEYTPKDKTTNNTYNTYNEYINNYIEKNTYVTNNEENNYYPLDPENPSDPGGTVPDWSGGGDSGSLDPDGDGGFTFNLPDFSLPDLDIDWSISGLSEKFPFSIPFDLLAFFTVLNAEPETPAIQATIPLGLWEWEIDWDLHNFDNLAELLRTLEFIGFCIGLALITRNIIKG